LNYIIHLKKVAKQSAGKPKKGEISVNSIKFYPEDVIILIGHTRKVFGDLIYEAEGKVTNMRVVSVE
jgi:CheY-specific phosphatase CheX